MNIDEIKNVIENFYDLDEVIHLDALKAAVKFIESIQWWEGVYDDKPLTKEQIVNELTDYAFVLNQVPVVYKAVTGGKMSKPNYYADDVIREAQDYTDKQIENELNYYRKNPEELMDLLD